MKYRILSLLALAGVLFSGCVKENLPAEGGSILAVMENDDTRTSVTDEGKFTWSEGDQIWLHTTSGSVVGTLSSGAGTASADFSFGAYFGEMTNRAVYPYNDEHSISGDVLSVNMPASYDLGSNLTNTNAAMYGEVSDGRLKFNHMAGVMRFKFKNVPAGVNKFTITLDKKISGTFSADLTEAYPVIEAVETSVASEKTITLNFNALTETSELSLYVPLPLGTYNSLDLALYAGSQSVWTYSKSVTNTINRKSLKLMPTITLGGTIGGDIEGGESARTTEYFIKATYEVLQGGQMISFTDVEHNTMASKSNPIVCIDYGDGEFGLKGSHTFQNSGEYNVIFYFDKPVIEIGNWAFVGKWSPKSIIIPNTVLTIGEFAFYNCTLLEHVTFESGSCLKTIEACAFAYNSSLKKVILPSTIENIEEKVFAFCSSLECVYADGVYFNWALNFGGACLVKYENNYTYVGLIPSSSGCEKIQVGGVSVVLLAGAVTANNTLQSVRFAHGLLEIGEYNFIDCESLEEVYMSKTQKIGTNVFINCSSLKAVSMPVVSEISTYSICENASLEVIDFGSPDLKTLEQVGNNNPKLRKIHIPSGVTTITNSFNGASSIESVYVSSLTPPALSESFDGVSQGVLFYVPCGALDAYKSSAGWSSFSDMMMPYDFEKGEICVGMFPSHYIDEYGIDHGHGVKIGETVWAPVNCGYHATDYKYGKFYQWGRKYGQGYDDDATTPECVLGPVSLEEGQSESNANKFYCSTSSPYNWLNEPNDQLWNAGTEDNPVKTEYDPCPEGWRVPTYAELSELSQNYSSWTTDNNGQTGYYFSGSESYSSTVSQVFFPAAGLRYGVTAEFRGNSVYYWSSSTYGNSANYLFFDSSSVGMGGSFREFGFSVRCVQATDEVAEL